MRILVPIAFLLLAAAPAAAQGIVVPIRCHGACAADGPLARTIVMDSVEVWANLQRGGAITYVDHQFRNDSGDTIDAAFFFPLPADAALGTISVYDAVDLVRYNEWSGPDESRWIAEGILRDQRHPGLRAYEGMKLVHVPVGAIPPHGIGRLQIAYSQPVPAVDGAHTYR
jgi:hypothetical protein